MGDNLPFILKEPRLLRCSKCKEWKPDRKFYRRKSSPKIRRMRSHSCIACDRLYQRQHGSFARLFEAMAKRAEKA